MEPWSKILHSVKFCLDIHESCQTCVIGKIQTLEKWFIKAYIPVMQYKGEEKVGNKPDHFTFMKKHCCYACLEVCFFFFRKKTQLASLLLAQKQVIASAAAEGGEKRKLFHTSLRSPTILALLLGKWRCYADILVVGGEKACFPH